jgi:hypothetical protein
METAMNIDRKDAYLMIGLASIAAVLLVLAVPAGTAAAATSRPGDDVNEYKHPIIAVVQKPPPDVSQITVSIKVTVDTTPLDYHARLELMRYQAFLHGTEGGWVVYGRDMWNIRDLPPAGKSKTWVATFSCAPGNYYTRWVQSGVNSEGRYQSFTFYWPYLNWNSKNAKRQRPDIEKPPTVRQAQLIRHC